ncbi:hypothetical protein EJ05DRAFT_53231 [Pseudovirgaria hyperparasitica]|uniref:Uncharacterized protein n=1 Tax=Pseudovirgaria hyperparasitica TaxID=470096 RepID=A0A6A6W3A2_9PEZI|nr:uncharacterized protein EJ05DRAFT_53231 [Pseudovirgaria hyperparasitica]KAF2757045.1 hypothetical protein EJ05DRAFT_53231 [Pseudovirgaria hyperparasitica]
MQTPCLTVSTSLPAAPRVLLADSLLSGWFEGEEPCVDSLGPLDKIKSYIYIGSSHLHKYTSLPVLGLRGYATNFTPYYYTRCFYHVRGTT